MVSKGQTSSSSSNDMVADSIFEYPPHDIGTRIESGGYLGTIKYIGPIEGHPGVWLGIEWDDPTRGKHNGTVDGVTYFTAQYPKSGSFLRREKVNFGQTLTDAIINRYQLHETSSEIELNKARLSSLRKNINAPFIDLVGFDKVKSKQSNVEALQIVSVRMQNVSSIGDSLEFKRLCPMIKELDLSKNLFTKWTDIFEICSQLDHLVWLNVSENLLTLPENIEKCEYTFPKIQVLVCGQMKLVWPDVMALSKIFTGLKELSAPHNFIRYLSTRTGDSLENLEILSLETNAIKKWNEVLKLSNLNNLRYLILDNIGLEIIRFDTPGTFDGFWGLKRLAISENRISDWRSVSELNKLPCLEDLKFTRNPVLSSDNVELRDEIIIAKIARLKVLNGRRLKDDERRSAEYDYLRKYGLEWLKVKNTPEEQDFLERHNRYRELMDSPYSTGWSRFIHGNFNSVLELLEAYHWDLGKEYGEPEESEYVVPQNIIKSTLITVNLVYQTKTITKKIPPSMLIQKLILLVQKLFHLSARPTLTYVSSNNSQIEIELDDEMKEVGFYSIQENDVILVRT